MKINVEKKTIARPKVRLGLPDLGGTKAAVPNSG